ncbi:cytochrome c [Breoghania sp.]|uniref:c-type cytochrome n=1 Tax=Breoghania sp. TaxID=2065378 RepID=UPI002AA6E75A|nr:cytochrome c [Breoghania sp.]
MRHWHKMAIAVPALAGAALLVLARWQIADSEPLQRLKGDPARGAYLARMAGCIGCHTNFSSGGAPLAGGVAFETDFGTFHSPNLTTDPEHGIGNWNKHEFARAVRRGISPEGEPYYPAFPYPFYAGFSDQDVMDLWAAFRTVPPVAAPSRDHDLTPPFNLRSGLKIWRELYPADGTFKPDTSRGELWNRGKFIVEGPAHCGACHTPRDLLGARKTEMALEGATGLPGGGSAPSITPQALSKRGWSVDSLAYALRSGIQPDGDVFGGSMAEVVRDSTAFLSDEDRKAIAVYLLDAEA